MYLGINGVNMWLKSRGSDIRWFFRFEWFLYIFGKDGGNDDFDFLIFW